MNEFDIIRRLFAPLARSEAADGLRDDVAEIVPGAGRLIATADAIVEGVHFLPSDPIDTVAAKLLRVNVSDIIAKGGKPDGALLTLVWPQGRGEGELEAFATSLGRELAHWGAHLLGGDTTSTPGPLTLSLTLLGRCGVRGPVRRSGAKAGEDVWVTGVIGDGWLGLQAAQGALSAAPQDSDHLLARYRVPEPPPVAFAAIIDEFAGASIDVSDGLAADAGHIASASGVELVIDWMNVPLSDAARRWLGSNPDGIGSLLTGGDDYQTLFTAPRAARHEIAAACASTGVQAACIGRVEPGAGVRFMDGSGAVLALPRGGWAHFQS
jgi:thiamine-monophosphate kinase